MWRVGDRKKHHAARCCVADATKKHQQTAQPCFASRVTIFILANLEFEFSILQAPNFNTFVISGPADHQYLSHKLSPESRQLERAEAIKVHQSLIKKNQCAANVENCSHGERLDEWRVSQSECSSIELSGQRSVAHTETGWQIHLFLAPSDLFP